MKKLVTIAVTIFIAVIVCVQNAKAQIDTIYVDSIADASIPRLSLTIRYAKAGGLTSGNCGTWANAGELQYVLELVSTTGDEIWVAKGTYKPTNGADRKKTFQLKSGVTLYGGFRMTETNRSQRNIDTNITILSGDIGIAGDSTDNSYHVVSSNGVINTAVLDGFIITGGNANGDTTYGVGGGMYNLKGDPVLANIKFDSNYAAGKGGGMYSLDGSPRLTNITFSNNSADKGGGMCNDSSSPNIINSIFKLNSAENGGGMSNYSSSPIITNCIFTGNWTDGLSRGGGIFDSGSFPIFRNSIVWGNEASNGNEFYIDSGKSMLNYSCYKNDPGDIYTGSDTMFAADGYCITLDPLFVDAAAGDLRVSENSPCVDAGNNAYNNELYDIRGTGYLRKLPKIAGQDSTIDMGAYENEVKDDTINVIYERPGGPKRFALSQNYPNPFNPVTTITFTLAENDHVSLKVFDIIGREVITLVDARLIAGVEYHAILDASKLSSGFYFYRLEAGKNIQVKKLILLK